MIPTCFKPHSVIPGRTYTHKQPFPITSQFAMSSLIPTPQETPTLALLMQPHLLPHLFLSPCPLTQHTPIFFYQCVFLIISTSAVFSTVPYASTSFNPNNCAWFSFPLCTYASCLGDEGEAEKLRKKMLWQTVLPKSTCFPVPWKHMAGCGKYSQV